MTLVAGTTVGRYQILEPLGQGGMATVYKAFQPSLQREVALKVLRPGYAQDQEFLERFEREAFAIAKLRHPHIVQVFDFEAASGQYVLAMEYLEGGTLKERLAELARSGRLIEPPEAVRIVAEVADALDYAHELGIVHRDVKPSNVMLTRKDRAVVTDFGIARILGATSHTQTGVGIGTPEYMAPEQGQGTGVDHKADIYSLGVLAYELFTGRVPYSADTPLAVVLSHIREPLPLPSSVNPAVGPAVERVLLRALAKDPAQRHDSAGDLADSLKAALSEDQKDATLGTLIVRRPAAAVAATAATVAPAAAARSVTLAMPPLLTRRPVVLGIAGALVLALVAGGIGFALTRPTGATGQTSIDPIPKGALYYEAKLDGTQSFIRPGSLRKNARGGATSADPDAVALRTTVGAIELANVKPLSHIEFAFDAPVRQNYVVELDVQAPGGGKAIAELYLRTGTGGMYWLNISPDGGSAVNHNPGGPSTLTQRVGERFFLPPLMGDRPVAIAIVVEDTRFTIFADGRQYAQVDGGRVVPSAQPIFISNYSAVADATGTLRITRARFFELDKTKIAAFGAIAPSQATLPATPVASSVAAGASAAAPTLPPTPQPRTTPTADPNAPKVQVSGRVTSAVNGQGLAGVNVQVGLAAQCCVFANTTSSFSGQYKLDLPAGSYKLLFALGADTGYAPIFFGDGTDYSTARVVVVGSTALTGIDQAMRPGFLVTGRVTGPGGGAPAVRPKFDISLGNADDGNKWAGFGTGEASGVYSARLAAGTYTFVLRREDTPSGTPFARVTVAVEGDMTIPTQVMPP